MLMITLCILIIIHEYGHFYIARYFNVCITCFSLGFGPKITEFTDKYGTKYIIRLFLLGGYIKILDDKYHPITNKIKKYIQKYKLLFYDQLSFFKKFLIILSGPIANIIFAIIIYWFVFFISLHNNKPIIKNIYYNSIADHAKLPINTEIKKINNKTVLNWDDVNIELHNIFLSHQKNIVFLLKNINQPLLFEKNISINFNTLNVYHNNFIAALGIIPEYINIIPIITSIEKHSIAAQIHLNIGDQIIKTKGSKIMNWYNLQQYLFMHNNRNIFLYIKRKNQILLMKVRLPKLKEMLLQYNYIGITPKIIYLKQNIYNTNFKYKFLISLSMACKKIFILIRIICFSLKNLILIHNISLDHFSGPIYIGYMIGVLAKKSIISYLCFLALISINIAIMNLLPLPILDGGQLCFLICENIIKRKISLYIKILAYNISIILIIFIMGISVIHDYTKILHY
ncbi:RIP metalloprotease RseP [Enterobacteriaceae endosymbiont of Macroplea appendiculata]|uniref:RIP metalloprotease RseP n=1 Tax=Enterobacteriaceae endosymbiont of Macroplea appendiculata TaxID=2675790 RepID=UPI001449FA3A|nr:RIP metalloprotease RseP [Enterobacteriaceae endosymbiont of Macroplea appendiculata]QJC30840.1 RIP metalloprotease RseP [Enterobacteriaceae endosymbiont of Macroplea appendiculata]